MDIQIIRAVLEQEFGHVAGPETLELIARDIAVSLKLGAPENAQ